MSISELEHAIRTGSALSDLTEMAARDGLAVSVIIWPDRSFGMRVWDHEGDSTWEWKNSGPDLTRGMQKAVKAITARRLHEENR